MGSDLRYHFSFYLVPESIWETTYMILMTYIFILSEKYCTIQFVQLSLDCFKIVNNTITMFAIARREMSKNERRIWRFCRLELLCFILYCSGSINVCVCCLGIEIVHFFIYKLVSTVDSHLSWLGSAGIVKARLLDWWQWRKWRKRKNLDHWCVLQSIN